MVRSSNGGEGRDGGSALMCMSSSAVLFGCLLSIKYMHMGQYIMVFIMAEEYSIYYYIILRDVLAILWKYIPYCSSGGGRQPCFFLWYFLCAGVWRCASGHVLVS